MRFYNPLIGSATHESRKTLELHLSKRDLRLTLALLFFGFSCFMLRSGNKKALMACYAHQTCAPVKAAAFKGSPLLCRKAHASVCVKQPSAKHGCRKATATCVQRFDDSQILQFTLLIALCYVLHRYTSQEIHR